MKKFIFSIMMLALVVLVTGLLFKASLSFLKVRYAPFIAHHIVNTMSEEEKKQHYEGIVSKNPALWDTVPEPNVGRIGQAYKTSIHKQAEVTFNNAGMRSKKDYLPKDDQTFRIVCLGDSFVFGTGGPEEHRFCNQIEDFYHSENINIEGKPIETLALGLGSWNAIQEASYLSSRLSSFDPDIIIVLTTRNDITSSSGVTGKGFLSNQFSPEFRDKGNGILLIQGLRPFKIPDYNLLSLFLSPSSQMLWQKTMASFQEMTRLQHARGKKILFSVLDNEAYFSSVFLQQYHSAKIPAPVIVTDYLVENDTQLPHDGHPNFSGHGILANHYIHTLDKLGWVEAQNLPLLNPALSTDTSAKTDSAQASADQKALAAQLKSKINFNQLLQSDAPAILGGLHAEYRSDSESPICWSSPNSAFLLKQPESDLSSPINATLQFSLPDKIELFPMILKLYINDSEYTFQYDYHSVGEQSVTVENLDLSQYFGVAEIRLEASSYFTEIDRHNMASLQLHSAELYSQIK